MVAEMAVLKLFMCTYDLSLCCSLPQVGLNKANVSDTEVSFCDINLSISNGICFGWVEPLRTQMVRQN